MIAARFFACCAAFARRSARSTLPLSSQADDHDLHAGHVRRGRIGAVRRARDEADVAMALAAALVPRPDDEQSRVLALRARVGLHRHGRVTGALDEHLLETRRSARGSPPPAPAGANGCRLRELGPGDRDHLARGVELHGARAERDHGAVERDVLVGEAAQVAQHLGLGVVAVEDRVREERARCARAPPGCLPPAASRSAGAKRRRRAGEDRPQSDATSSRVVVSSNERPSVASSTRRRFTPRLRAARRRWRRSSAPVFTVRVSKKALAGTSKPSFASPAASDRREAVHAARDALEALRAVVDRVHRGHHGEQHLRRADVGGRLLAADVLLARLQREAVGGIALRVDRHADEAPRHAALELVLRREVARVRAAVAHRARRSAAPSPPPRRRPIRPAARAP